jgi:hypothetical protein
VFGSDEKLQTALLAVPMEMQRIAQELRAGLAEFHNGTRITGARYVPVSRQLAWGGSGRLVGWSVLAVDGPVTVQLRDGRDASADVVAIIDLVAGESETMALSGGGVAFGEALYLDASGAGRLVGAVHLGAVD